jgi:hypothetical protein
MYTMYVYRGMYLHEVTHCKLRDVIVCRVQIRSNPICVMAAKRRRVTRRDAKNHCSCKQGTSNVCSPNAVSHIDVSPNDVSPNNDWAPWLGQVRSGTIALVPKWA